LALVWAGRSREESQPWEALTSTLSRLHLRHPALGEWRVEYPGLPSVGGGEKSEK